MIAMIPLPDIPNPFGGIGDFAGDIIGRLFSFIIDDFVGAAIATVTDGLIAVMLSSSSVSLTGDFAGMGDIRAMILGLSFTTMFAILLIGVIKATLTGQPGALIRQAFYDLPRQAFITAVFIGVAQTAIVVVDALTVEILDGVGEGIGRLGGSILLVGAGSSAAGGPAAGGILVLIFMILYILAAIFVWAELLIRSALIYIIAVLAPLGYALGVSPSGRDIARKTTMSFAAIILSKLGIAIAFRVGAGLVNGDGEGGIADAMVGVTTMGLAAYMPFMILKAIPLMESAAVAEGAERAPLRAAGTAAGVGIGLALAAGNVASLAGGGGGASGGGGAAGAGGGGGAGGGAGSRQSPSPSGGLGGGGRSTPALERGPIVSGPGGDAGAPAELDSSSSAALPRGPIIAGPGSGGSPQIFAAPASGSSGVQVIDLTPGADGRFRDSHWPTPHPALTGGDGGRPSAQLGPGSDLTGGK